MGLLLTVGKAQPMDDDPQWEVPVQLVAQLTDDQGGDNPFSIASFVVKVCAPDRETAYETVRSCTFIGIGSPTLIPVELRDDVAVIVNTHVENWQPESHDIMGGEIGE